ncbi:MAG: hypothetical protein COV47_05740 [Candidatus Diapherotrites archaeon CG11_big_fil_rev_8_21_14_0_20_37_9]|nr:MAG: hypothetical protein COV47_05740 [Candidatus Diapherotrites archaeon CG11_big_fil_rev_8_21_14_0_20_37_9]
MYAGLAHSYGVFQLISLFVFFYFFSNLVSRNEKFLNAGLLAFAFVLASEIVVWLHQTSLLDSALIIVPLMAMLVVHYWLIKNMSRFLGQQKQLSNWLVVLGIILVISLPSTLFILFINEGITSPFFALLAYGNAIVYGLIFVISLIANGLKFFGVFKKA